MKRRILILSGGGCRGYIQAQVLKKLEKESGPLYRNYDLICGSSVGAINGSMIASGKISMIKMESMYPEMIKRIFKRRILPPIPLYDRKNFIKVFVDEIGMIKMKECKTRLQVTSVNLCDKRNHFFKSWDDKDGEEYLVSVTCRSFAAPYYFGTLVDENSKSVWFDGGMGIANVPISYGLIDAMQLWPNDEWHFDIIGCGFANEKTDFDKAKKYRVIRQVFSYLDFDDGGLARNQVRIEQIYGIQAVCQNSKNKVSMRYFDIEIPKELDKLDGVEYLPQYKDFGEQMSKQPLIVA